jgi:hypothetical protein
MLTTTHSEASIGTTRHAFCRSTCLRAGFRRRPRRAGQRRVLAVISFRPKLFLHWLHNDASASPYRRDISAN